jgi:hypothetical protein
MSNGLPKIPVQMHNETNRIFDSEEFWKRVRWAGEIKDRTEPGDMRERGVWSFENDFSYVPYSQMSCSYGLANIYRAAHLDRVSELTRQHGRVFLFTTVTKSLREAALSRPEEFIPLINTESWMAPGRMVTLFGSIYAHGRK